MARMQTTCTLGKLQSFPEAHFNSSITTKVYCRHGISKHQSSPPLSTVSPEEAICKLDRKSISGVSWTWLLGSLEVLNSHGA